MEKSKNAMNKSSTSIKKLQYTNKQIRLLNLLKKLSMKFGRAYHSITTEQSQNLYLEDNITTRLKRMNYLDNIIKSYKITNKQLIKKKSSIKESLNCARKHSSPKKNLTKKSSYFNIKISRDLLKNKKLSRNLFGNNIYTKFIQKNSTINNIDNSTRRRVQTNDSHLYSKEKNNIKNVRKKKFKNKENKIEDFEQKINVVNSGDIEIPEETIKSICTYHQNMARKFPKIQRSTEDQEKRDRNTKACRLSRRAKKLEEMVIENDYSTKVRNLNEVVKECIRVAVYANELSSLLNNNNN